MLTNLPGGNSMLTRIALIGGGLVILLIIFTVLKGLLTSGPDLTPVVAVVQQQQELIHLVTTAQQSQQGNLSVTNKNFAATLQLTLGTSQGKTIQYLATNHKKLKAKQLNLKVSALTDKRLAGAAAAGNYDQTFTEIMQAQLNTYGSDLALAYKQGYGPKGKALLKDDYRQLQLFKTQLNATPN